MRKRILSVLMALCMVLSLAPTMAWAAGAATSVTIDDNTLNSTNPYYFNGTAADENGSVSSSATKDGKSWNAKFENGVLTLNGLHVNDGKLEWGNTSSDLTIVLEGENTVVNGEKILPITLTIAAGFEFDSLNLSKASFEKVDSYANMFNLVSYSTTTPITLTALPI